MIRPSIVGERATFFLSVLSSSAAALYVVARALKYSWPAKRRLFGSVSPIIGNFQPAFSSGALGRGRARTRADASVTHGVATCARGVVAGGTTTDRGRDRRHPR